MPLKSVAKRLAVASPATMLTLVLAGIVVLAAGSIPDSQGVFHGCYKQATGALRVVVDASQCLPTETAIQWNQQGQQGPPGAQGPQGPAGPAGPAGPSDAFATYREVGDSRGPITLDVNGAVVAQLNLPAGSYVAWASLYATNQSASAGILACILLINNERNAQAITTLAPGQAANQALTVADTLSAPASVKLFCNDNVLGTATLSVQTFNLTAIRTGTLAIASS
jgi:hypothetical protein